jgi:hypothetical protein
MPALAAVQFASARTEPQAHASASTISVSGKEFSLKLSAQSIARPGTVTFNFKNAGHMLHDFKINGHKTPLTKPGKTAKLTVSFQQEGQVPLSLHRARTCSRGDEARFHGSLTMTQQDFASGRCMGGRRRVKVLSRSAGSRALG